jgi:uncharacterized repeat protein (TIGR03803 family)
MKRISDVLSELNWGKRAYAVLALCAATAIALPAQTFTTLHSFSGYPSDGQGALAGLVQATDGDLYGTTTDGGANCAPYGCGTVFKITPSGTLTTLYSFCSQSGCTDGENPTAGLVQATNGDFYGTTKYGGNSGHGTVFRITPSGILRTLHSFGGADGENPAAGLVQATNGDFYGTTPYGGANCTGTGPPPAPYGCGTVFKITPSGKLTTLYSFCSQSGCTDGEIPCAALVQATNGDLYGTTSGLGTDFNGTTSGTVFRITPGGALTTLHSFDGTDGEAPLSGLVQATNSNLYGTTTGVGCCAPPNDGTFFKITPSGTLTTLYNFCSQTGCTDGLQPWAVLIQANNGDFYGTTSLGGLTNANCNYGCGTIFRIAPNGTLTTLHSFDDADGASPNALVQATNGTFYGTTQSTVFSLSVGLGPFLKTLPSSGKVGAVVKILGTNLTAATSVSFNGTAAVFNVVSRSEITTIVPTGATTGKVKVVTPSGTLSSNVPFRVP